MKLLIIGGSIFLGRHLVTEALRKNHEVWIFNRGQSGPIPSPVCHVLQGNRESQSDLKKLSTMKFDAVIDTCGYVPRVVRTGLEILKDIAPHYLFASTISVYANPLANADETSPLMTSSDPQSEDVQKHYGGLKVLCENAVRTYFPNRNTNVRLGFLVGPYDRIYRLPYWLERLAAGGEVIAPGNPSDPFQCIDIRDAAAWMVLCAEKKIAGDFNVTGHVLPLGNLLNTCNQTLGDKAQLTWIPHSFLRDQGITAFDEIPYNISDEERGAVQISIAKALANGLTFRSLTETICDTHAWLAKEGFSVIAKAGEKIKARISRARELEILESYNKISNLHIAHKF
ncbi:MAG: NAD-dependent epimerase/dehydratase family protein [Bdellovibrio sp.]|nr:NAD-dependent epimerase/dehydratase family protein [Bdellovibrio sp.]